MHVGKRIQEVVKERGLTVVGFSRALPCSRENAYKIFHRNSIDSGLLERICQVLDHDFFKDFSECGQYAHM